jgi:ATP phosphoribosyltransferase
MRLTIAIPRGALFGDALDLLDQLGTDTGEIRSNDRKLVFPEIGVITMRPSDIPSYVEHGAADVGITGRDVLAEQSDRDVYELLDLRFGACRMIVAAHEDGDPLTESLRRLGRVRIATKYPRIAAAHFAATGRTLAENRLVEREPIFESTARLIANPVAHRLKAAEIDDLVARIRSLS